MKLLSKHELRKRDALARKKEKRAQARLNRKLKLLAYDNFRIEVLKRDNHTDVISNKQSGGNLHVHHILDKKHFPQFKCEPLNGITLSFYNHKVGPLSPHMNSIFFSEWLKINRPVQWEWVINRLKEMKLL